MRIAADLTARLAAFLPALALGIALTGAPAGAAGAEQWPANSYVIQVNGLACPYCGYGIEKQFARQSGVQGTKIDVERGVVVVSVTPTTRLSDDALERIVDAAGFALGGIVHRPQGE